MVFSSPAFMFLFLPVIILLVFAFKSVKAKNIVLLSGSLLFYAWGEPDMVVLMIISIIANHFIGRTVSKNKKSKRPIIFGIIFNVLVLSFFKYANFFIENFNLILIYFEINPIPIPDVRLPIGISFFTFQSMSYLIDIYRKDAGFSSKITHTALYISLFPQLIAGPIVRYRQVAESLKQRNVGYEDIHAGASRFIFGLSKKILIANPMGYVADNVFKLDIHNLSSPVCWLGAIAYSLQIFFDFSGYSDMAIGLGRIFGFKFPENFNFPYISKSIKEFWRRWHISLSTWFRDYLYIPLGGNKCSKSRNLINLLIVFLLTGLWHGASWTFVVWGLFHGFFLVAERGLWGRLLNKMPSVMKHLYVFCVFIIGWVFFRADDFGYAVSFISEMFKFEGMDKLDQAFYYLKNENIIYLLAGIAFSLPVKQRISKFYFYNLKWFTIIKYTKSFAISIISCLFVCRYL